MARALAAEVRRSRIPSPRRVGWPSVGVVIPTRDRPNLLRRALASVLDQDYRGSVRVVVVFDGPGPDWRLAGAGPRPVLVLGNWRTPGPAGSRNCGILAAADCELVAFCDDADVWSPTKLTAQISAMRARPGTLFATCAVEVEYDGRRTAQLAGVDSLGVDDLARSPVCLPRRSGFVACQRALATEPDAGGIGLFAEDAPTGLGEDWDLLLRAARRHPIAHVDAPLVRVLWRRCPGIEDEGARQVRGLRWMMARHPEISGCASAAARVYGEIAYWEAARGNRAAAWAWVRAALRIRWHEPRLVQALGAIVGMLRPDARLARVDYRA